METDLRVGRFTGILPILYINLARNDCRIQAITHIWLDKNGDPVLNITPVPGIKISFRKASLPVQTLYYFQADIRDNSDSAGRFFKWCESIGSGNSLLKSATYLLHETNFDVARQFLLSRSKLLVQDDSGIPLRFFDTSQWTLQCHGTYTIPIRSFEKYQQPDLSELYRQQKPTSLQFGFGYMSRPANSGLMIAIKKAN